MDVSRKSVTSHVSQRHHGHSSSRRRRKRKPFHVRIARSVVLVFSLVALYLATWNGPLMWSEYPNHIVPTLIQFIYLILHAVFGFYSVIFAAGISSIIFTIQCIASFIVVLITTVIKPSMAATVWPLCDPIASDGCPTGPGTRYRAGMIVIGTIAIVELIVGAISLLNWPSGCSNHAEEEVERTGSRSRSRLGRLQPVEFTIKQSLQPDEQFFKAAKRSPENPQTRRQEKIESPKDQPTLMIKMKPSREHPRFAPQPVHVISQTSHSLLPAIKSPKSPPPPATLTQNQNTLITIKSNPNGSPKGKNGNTVTQ